MPVISRFLGIVISMYYREHGPPHFHAIYAEHDASIDIDTGEVRGYLRIMLDGWCLNGRRSTRQNCLKTGAWPAKVCRSVLLNRWSNRMHYLVVEARHVSGYRVWLRFRDGTSGEIDLESELHGPMFEPLKDAEFFRQFRVHPELKTLVWPNGADFAPEFLHDNVRVTA